MGEVLRSSFAKRYTKKHLHKLRAVFRQAHQWGVGVPGACEAWRTGAAPWRSWPPLGPSPL
eukprot:9480034-Pyramimonas_sp.AAC.1